MMLRKSLILLAVITVALTTAEYGRSQGSQSGQSLAEAARKAREQQKNEPKSAKVFTDDDVANIKGQISVVGSEPPAPAPDSSAAAAKPAAASKEPAKDEAYWRKKFADARRVLADDQREADVLQREYGLKQVQFYANPNTALQQQYSRKDLDDTQAERNAKKADVDKDNQAISDLQDQLRQSGGEPGWGEAPTSNAPAASESNDVCDDCESDGHSAPSGATASGGSAPASQPSDQTQTPSATQP